MPFTSSVGRAVTRSSVVKPFSPNGPGAPLSRMKPASSKGSSRMAVRSTSVMGRTLS